MAGISLVGQQSFDTDALRGECFWRPTPVEADLSTSHLTHEHYDHPAGDSARHSVFPLQGLRELVVSGESGGRTTTLFSLSGYLPDWAEVVDQFAPALAERVVEQHPNAVPLVPV